MNYYLVQTPDVSFSWIGGEAKPAGAGMVWLCKPDGEPVLKVPENCVRRSTREETAQRILNDRRVSKAPMN